MFRRLIPLVAILSAGCVPVTEPLTPVEKAEPDKALVGTWKLTYAKLTGRDPQLLRIEADPGKGNPKGMMKFVIVKGAREEPIWVHLSKIGTERYGSAYMASFKDIAFADFGKDGAYEAWKKGEGKWYLVFAYSVENDELQIDLGHCRSTDNLMQGEKFPVDPAARIAYRAPAGWLVQGLEKNGKDFLFKYGEPWTYERVKK
jgi:hypothetical protein